MNNNVIPGDWKKAIVVPIYKGEERSVVGNHRPASLTSVVCNKNRARYSGVPKRSLGNEEGVV